MNSATFPRRQVVPIDRVLPNGVTGCASALRLNLPLYSVANEEERRLRSGWRRPRANEDEDSLLRC